MSAAMNKDIHVVVLMGGWSAEREVSLTSGRGVAQALRERGWSKVTELDMDRNVAHALAETRPEAGMWPILAARATSVTFFGVAAAAGRRSLRMPGTLALTLLCGVVDMAANALYLVAARAGPLSLVVTLASLYPASTVLLARIILGERLNARQVAGVGCALAAIVLIVSGGAG